VYGDGKSATPLCRAGDRAWGGAERAGAGAGERVGRRDVGTRGRGERGRGGREGNGVIGCECNCLIYVNWRQTGIMTCMSRPTILFCLLFLSVCCVAQQQKEKTPEFPNTEEIQLVVTQSDHVFEQYKQSVTMETAERLRRHELIS
jgi:hypothetical protein